MGWNWAVENVNVMGEGTHVEPSLPRPFGSPCTLSSSCLAAQCASRWRIAVGSLPRLERVQPPSPVQGLPSLAGR